VFKELCYNLESFNPAFTSCLLMVQRTIGVSDYERRDMALKVGFSRDRQGQAKTICSRWGPSVTVCVVEAPG
jgi:hypothetical protein